MVIIGETDSIIIHLEQLPDSSDLPLPEHMTGDSSGVDLLASVPKPVVIKAGAIALIPTGLKISIPTGFEGQVRPRSGLALRHGITVLNSPGTIDADYRGEVKVILINAGKEDFTVKRGERIAQLVIAPVLKVKFKLVDKVDPTPRNSGGFGSTGK